MVSVYVYGAVPPLAAMPTLIVPLTSAPAAGVVNEALSGLGPPFCTVTVRVAGAGPPLASRTDTVSVVGPFGVDVVIQGMLIGPFDVSLVVATTWPPAVSVNDRLPAAAFSIQTTTHTVPVTVAPFEGCVMNTEIVPVLFCTVTVRVAVAVAPVLSRTVRPSV